MKNIKIIVPIILLTGLFSCTLNSTQETALNQHLSHYLTAKKNCSGVGLAGFSHPEYVKEVKEQGDSIFQETFSCNEKGFIYDATLRKTNSKGDKIQIYYQLDRFNPNTGVREKRVESIIAISEDDGKTWFFIPKNVYLDKNAVKSIERLIEIDL